MQRLLLILAFALSMSAHPSGAATINTFATGVDESNSNALLADQAVDSNWSITSITGGSDGTTPRSARSTTSTSGWTPALSGSRYITRGTSRTGVIGATYTYAYQFTIDTSLFASFVLSGAVQADNQVRVLLNGNEILAQTGNIRGAGATTFITSDQSFFQNGVNTLTFEVLNTTETSTGLDATGLVSATAVPEPREWAIIFAAGGLLLVTRRREVATLLQKRPHQAI